jgi:hypothetical protein
LEAASGAVGGIGSRQGSKGPSFLKKRSKKLLFLRLPRDHDTPATVLPEQIKVFWFFFSKKNMLSSCVSHGL